LETGFEASYIKGSGAHAHHIRPLGEDRRRIDTLPYWREVMHRRINSISAFRNGGSREAAELVNAEDLGTGRFLVREIVLDDVG